MILRLKDVAKAIGAPPPRDDVNVTGWSVDSRSLAKGDLFFALCGPHHDGHDFIRAALAKGASGVVTERRLQAPNALVVRDSLAALQRLATIARQSWGGLVVGVTGSAGKTTTKDAIAHLLAGALAVGKSAGNLNNHVGVPLAILRLPGESRVAVLEMGMNHAGEIAHLCKIARPEIGVLTNVGSAHVEAFESVDAVARAKRELIQALPEDGVAVLNADDQRVAAFRQAHAGPAVTFGFSPRADVRAVNVELGAVRSRFVVDGVPFETPLAGRHGILNLLAALAVARVFEVDFLKLRARVSEFAPGPMRGERMVHEGITIWNDCYNSNPEAARAMLDLLAATPAGRRIAVLGEMLELGRAAETLHREVGQYCAQRGLDVLIGVRGAARHMVDAALEAGMSDGAAYFFETPEQAGDFLRTMARFGDAVLFKASRGVAIEHALERLLA